MNDGENGERRRMRPEGDGEQRMRGGDMSQLKSGRMSMGRIWLLEDGKNLKSVSVRTGLNDNRYIEIMSKDLKEGDEIVLGILGPETASAQNQQSNPFAPRMTTGGGGGGRSRF